MAYFGGNAGGAFGGYPGGGAGGAFGGYPGGGAGGAFGGYPGGYNLSPGGAYNANFAGAGFPPTLGSNLPPVDPNNFPGTVHFGQATTQSGQFPPGANAPNWNYGGGGGAFYPGY